MTHTLESLIEPALDIARDAGQKILEIYETDFEVEEKADASPLTAADMASHKTILAGLEQFGLPVLSEESAQLPFEHRAQWSRYWLVDPLDGTKEFVNRNGEFTVNIALIENHVPVLGVVHVPVKDTDYYGSQKTGAFMRVGSDPAKRISVQRRGSGPVRVVGSKSHRGNSLDRYLANLGEHELIPMGSSLKLCLVAAGEADVYPRLGPTSEWDTAAAQAVVECAGGKVVDTSGNPIRYNAKEDILNPHFIVYGDGKVDWLKFLEN